jgi:hypothetical protein
VNKSYLQKKPTVAKLVNRKINQNLSLKKTGYQKLIVGK